MSASIAILPRTALADLTPREVTERARAVFDFDANGSVLADVLAVLDERGVPLTSSELDELALQLARGASCFFFTHAHTRWIDALDPDRFPDAGDAIRDGVAFLRRALSAIDPDTVALLRIG